MLQKTTNNSFYKSHKTTTNQVILIHWHAVVFMSYPGKDPFYWHEHVHWMKIYIAAPSPQFVSNIAPLSADENKDGRPQMFVILGFK